MRPFTLLLALLALLSVCPGATVGQTDRFIPLVQDGGGWSTRVSITNLSDKPATVVAGFLTDKGYGEPWPIELKVSLGPASRGTFEGVLAPGATAIIQSSGAGRAMTRGFAEVIEIADGPIGVQAVLIQKIGEQQIQSLAIGLVPGHERRSVMPIDLRDPLRSTELLWVSITSSVVLEVTFRGLDGAAVLTDKVDLDGRAQISLRPVDRWPELAGFQGTVQWRVTFPAADRYEPRTLSGLQLQVGAEGQSWMVASPMTLASEQATVSPY